jgi:hypothetical protein
MNEWASLELAIKIWLNSRDLRAAILEIYNPQTGQLVPPRWDLDVVYEYGADGTLWADGDAIRYHVQKAGLVPSTCTYRFVLDANPGRPYVAGWVATTYRSTAGLRRVSVGTAIGGNGIGATAAYWGR